MVGLDTVVFSSGVEAPIPNFDVELSLEVPFVALTEILA